MRDADKRDDQSTWPRRAAQHLLVAGLVVFVPTGWSNLSAQEQSLCAAKEKGWFEADYVGSQGRIAVCGHPEGNDAIGTIRVLQRGGTGSDVGTADFRVLAKASGDQRASVFTIRRYTRYRTTYLKFSFAGRHMETVIYDSFDDGQTATSMKQTSLATQSTSEEIQLKPRSGSLSLMGLESVVRILPFDE